MWGLQSYCSTARYDNTDLDTQPITFTHASHTNSNYIPYSYTHRSTNRNARSYPHLSININTRARLGHAGAG